MTPDPLLLAVAPNGARRTKLDHPDLPLTATEIALEARRCHDVGARLLHLHVRDDAGEHSLEPRHYRAAIEAVRDEVGETMTIQVSTEAAGRYDIDSQIQVVRELEPAAASFGVRELVPDSHPTRPVAAFFDWVGATGLEPQFIVYSTADVDHLHHLLDHGMLSFESPFVLFVLGHHAGGPPSTTRALETFIDAWSDRGPWAVCAFGPAELDMAAAALAAGGHVRVGFENNIVRPDGTPLDSTAEQAARVAALAEQLGRPLVDRLPDPLAGQPTIR